MLILFPVLCSAQIERKTINKTEFTEFKLFIEQGDTIPMFIIFCKDADIHIIHKCKLESISDQIKSGNNIITYKDKVYYLTDKQLLAVQKEFKKPYIKTL